MMTPRHDRPMESRDLPGQMPDPDPRCGRPLGHGGQCLSRRAWQRAIERSRENRERARRKERA